jgi:general secretion pathway protein D
VVSGTFDDIRLIKGIVDKIDVLLAQVSIQVVIAEVTLSDTDQSGIQRAQPRGRQGPERRNLDHRGHGTVAGWTSGPSPGAARGAGVNPLSFLATLQSAGDKHKVKILQEDTITTTHNKQATPHGQRAGARHHGTTGVPIAATTTATSFATSSRSPTRTSASRSR